ncbi:LLM class flavin-dependent oxidoreductase [Streptomyces paradoxus]|uniref:LLM class flavin-dependent oxidoreductase n=1 Tax=Streptomyces paradoxus TaxID=66375 RepID=UPI0036334C56
MFPARNVPGYSPCLGRGRRQGSPRRATNGGSHGSSRYQQTAKGSTWLGVGGTPSSVERAARLGLPMVLGLIGGDIRRVRPLIEYYRDLGQAAGHPADALRLGLTSHFYVGKTSQGARDALYPHYREYLRPKTPGGRGWLVGPDDFQAVSVPSAR